MRVFVTDGDTRAALAVTRALGRRGHEVWVGEKRVPALAHTSRYCVKRITYPDPARDETGFVQTVRSIVEGQAIDVLLPVADVASILLAEHRAQFPSRCLIPCPELAVIERAADKADLVRRATRLGVPVPRSWFVDRRDAPLDPALPFPIVIKPHRSRVRTADGWLNCSVGYASSARELERELQRPAGQYPLILQERIVGPGAGVFACMVGGRPVALFSHRRLREKPPWGGVSVLSESVPINPRAREYALRLLGDLGWQGVAMVEFKLDDRDSEPKLMEINGRFWGSLQLAIDAGVDFPNILIDSLTGQTPAEPAGYRIGVRSRWWWGDVDSLILRLTMKRTGPEGEEGQGRMRAVADFAASWGRNLYYDNPKWDDVKPWLYESRNWLRGRP